MIDDADLNEVSLESQSVYRGALLDAYRDTVRLPDGSSATREWLDHPGAAAVVPFFEDGTILLVRQFRFAPRRVFLEVPAGKMDKPGEEPAAVALRELEEETGWTAREIRPLVPIYPCIGYSNEVIHLFVARDLHPGRQQLSEGEVLAPVRLPFEEALAMVRSGRIDDAKSVVALLLAGVERGSLER